MSHDDPLWRSEHRRRNQSSRDAFVSYTGHREHVMNLLVNPSRPRGSLCIVGAGNCNDIDLPRLLQHHDHISLVDIDPESVMAGVERQIGLANPRIWISESVDITGVLDHVQRIPSAEAVEERRHWFAELASLRAVEPRLDSPFAQYDHLASLCVLSQVIDTLAAMLGEFDAAFVTEVMGTRREHFEWIAGLVKPAGTATVVVDFVSTATFPHLMSIPEPELARELHAQITAQNFFTGLNPFAIEVLLKTDKTLSGLFHNVRLARPWRWDMGAKQFAVAALTMDRR